MTNDDDFTTPTEGSTTWVAELRRRYPTPEEADALLDKADRLAAIESQVLWRTEEMTPAAAVWIKDASGCRYIANVIDDLGVMHGSMIGEAPDYRPDEPGPIWLPILDPTEGY